jgi:hypothetical protein
MATLPEILAGQGESLVVHNHLQQMITFARAGGVEFVSQTDQGGVRKTFIDRLVRKNRLKIRIKAMLVRLIKGGKMLLYLRSVKDGYRIHDYGKESYRAYYNSDGDLESVVIIYSYKKMDGSQERDRWVKLRITAQWIEKQEGDAKPEFNQEYKSTEVFPPVENSLGFIPCVEVLNPVPASDKEGVSDFEELAAKIEAHDDMVTAIVDNVDFFCHSPLLTSRDASEVSECTGGDPLHQSGVAFASGFRPAGAASTAAAPGRTRRSRRLKKVIGGIDEGEMFSQLDVNPVPADLLNFADEYESKLRKSMGGMLERSINTATETTIVYGEVMATAAEKQSALYTLGVCEILEMALYAEEMLFLASGGTIGLPDLGDRTVNWRAAPVFVESTNDINLRTISARNLMKFVGVSAKEALKYTFPGKSDSELDVMVGDGGFPSDYLSTAIDMLTKLNSALDPLTQLPITDPATGLPLSSLLLPFIINNLNYGQQFNPEPDNDSPGSVDPNSAIAAALATFERLQQQQLDGVDGLGTAAVREPLELPTEGSTVNGGGSGGFGGFFDPNRSPILNGIKSIF